MIITDLGQCTEYFRKDSTVVLNNLHLDNFNFFVAFIADYLICEDIFLRQQIINLDTRSRTSVVHKNCQP